MLLRENKGLDIGRKDSCLFSSLNENKRASLEDKDFFRGCVLGDIRAIFEESLSNCENLLERDLISVNSGNLLLEI